MTVQILVNHYNEEQKIIKRFLDSLAVQTNVNFEVLIASDGGQIKLSKEFLDQYNFLISYAYLPHSGVCNTRNILLHKATADYIMFCDIDDMFFKSNGLSSLVQAAQQTNADLICSPFMVEYKEKKYKELEKDMLHVHGKLFKRTYLINNNICFPKELEYSGDMMMMWLSFIYSTKTIWIKNNFYIWTYQKNSITHRGIPVVSLYNNTLKCYDLLAQEFRKRNNQDAYQNLISKFISMIYIYANCPTWKIASQEQKEQKEYITKDCLIKYFIDYKKIDINKRKESYKLIASYFSLKFTENAFNQIIPWCEDILNPANILIIGYGIVGHNLEKELSPLSIAIYDKYKNIQKSYSKDRKYSIAFICVDTPKNEKSLCDITEVKNAIMENNADIFVLKSTILPGTVDKLCAETGKTVIFSPEYYGETQHCNNFTFDYTILGGDKAACRKVQQTLQKVYDGRHTFHITDAKTAELTKYMENAFLATKVSFCQQFYNLAKEIGIDYEDMRELFILDPRVNPSHTFVYEDQPWWDSKCLNKDVPAIAETYNAPLLLDVIKFNEGQKNLSNH